MNTHTHRHRLLNWNELKITKGSNCHVCNVPFHEHWHLLISTITPTSNSSSRYNKFKMIGHQHSCVTMKGEGFKRTAFVISFELALGLSSVVAIQLEILTFVLLTIQISPCMALYSLAVLVLLGRPSSANEHNNAPLLSFIILKFLHSNSSCSTTTINKQTLYSMEFIHWL